MSRTVSLSVIALCALAALAHAPASAGDERKELTPFVGYRFGGDFSSVSTGQDFDLQDSVDYGLVFDFPTSMETKVELLISHQETDVETNGFEGFRQIPIDITYFHVGAIYQPGMDDDMQPFVGATIGATYFDPDSPDASSSTDFSFSVGGGAKFFFSENVGIRLEGRLYGTITNGSGFIFCSAGCSIGFSGSAFWQLEANAGLIIAF